MGSLASALSLTERFGREHFTFTGGLPENFGIEVIIEYIPERLEHCHIYSRTSGKNELKYWYETFTHDIQPKPSRFSYDIPLTYHIGRCHMKLTSIIYRLEGRYGERDWERSGHHGIIDLTDTRSEWTRQFDAHGQLRLRGYCSRHFRLSEARSRVGEIEKSHFCYQADENWVKETKPATRLFTELMVGLDELAGKTVSLDIRLDPEERPFFSNRWIQFPEGWKPCLLTEDEWNSCQSPPVFKTFKMHGRECTVYPTCN